MNIDESLAQEVAILTLLLKEGKINDSQFKRLEDLIKTNRYARQCYIMLVNNDLFLKDSDILSSFDAEQPVDLLFEFAEYEKKAPAINIEDKASEREIIQKVVYEKQPRTLSKFTIFSVIFSVAAILLIVLFVKFIPESHNARVEVATLVDQVNAKWVQIDNPLQNGDRLLSNDIPLNLQQGIVKIQYDDGVNVCVEGPAVFEINKMGIYLEYGRLYSRVSETGLGFTVKTATSQFIDLGTEFGVHAGVDGSSELHVIKGKVQLFVGPKNKAKSSLIVTENKAVQYSARNSEIHEIPIAKQNFVRSIDSKSESVWRGQTRMNLADIVEGGDGFGDVESLVGLDPKSGQYTTTVIGKNRTSNNTYNLVSDSDFIDGVFVPDGGSGAVKITSAGLTFACPNTSGIFTHEIAVYKGSLENYNTSVPQFIRNGQKFENESLLYLHSNVGITFDLRAIHTSLPQLVLKSFKTKAGFPDTKLVDEGFPDVDCWILVDGQVRYQKRGIKLEDGIISIDIDLSARDRFLTIIVTDGIASVSSKRKFPYGLDSFFLIDPELTLIEKL